MKKQFRTRLISVIGKCIPLLTRTQAILVAENEEESADLNQLNSADYFTTNAELAEFLGCSPDTASKYKLRGFFPLTQVGQCSWVKIADAVEAVKNNPELALLVNNKKSFKKIVPRMITSIEKGSGRWSFIRLYYQKWSVILCVNHFEAIDPVLRVEICSEVIAMQHKKKPFRIAPVEPVQETFWAHLSFHNLRSGNRPAA